MTDFATTTLKAEGDPAWLFDHLGLTAENSYGFRTEEDGTHTLVVRTDDLAGVVDAVENYDALYLEHKLKPDALDRTWQLRRQNQARMMLAGQILELDDTTLDRLTQASQLLDRAAERGVPLDVIKWELVKGTFVEWPAQQVQDVAFAAGMHVQQTFSHQCDLYAAIRATTTAAALAALDLEGGWPNQ